MLPAFFSPNTLLSRPPERVPFDPVLYLIYTYIAGFSTTDPSVVETYDLGGLHARELII